MRGQVCVRHWAGVRQPHEHAPNDQGHKEEVYELIALLAMVAPVKSELWVTTVFKSYPGWLFLCVRA